MAQEYTQETDVNCCQGNLNREFSLLSTKTLEMNSKNNNLVEKKKEVTLQELLEEVAMIEAVSNNSEKKKRLSWTIL